MDNNHWLNENPQYDYLKRFYQYIIQQQNNKTSLQSPNTNPARFSPELPLPIANNSFFKPNENSKTYWIEKLEELLSLANRLKANTPKNIQLKIIILCAAGNTARIFSHCFQKDAPEYQLLAIKSVSEGFSLLQEKDNAESVNNDLIGQLYLTISSLFQGISSKHLYKPIPDNLFNPIKEYYNNDPALYARQLTPQAIANAFYEKAKQYNDQPKNLYDIQVSKPIGSIEPILYFNYLSDINNSAQPTYYRRHLDKIFIDSYFHKSLLKINQSAWKIIKNHQGSVSYKPLGPALELIETALGMIHFASFIKIKLEPDMLSKVDTLLKEIGTCIAHIESEKFLNDLSIKSSCCP